MKSLDAFLPAYDFSTRHAVTVAVDPVLADRALREVTFREVPLVRALLLMVPRATILEDVPGEGMVLRLSGQFWRLRGRGPEAPATAVVDFRALPGTLATETRVHVPDPVSRRRFGRYWKIVRPFSGLIRIVVLRAAKRRAEAA